MQMSDVLSWNALTSMATLGLLAVGYRQIRGIRDEALRERTLEACNQYDTNAIIHSTRRRLRVAQENGAMVAAPRKYRFDVITLMNYFDSIAIGIEQGLYLRELAQDHLEHILLKHVGEYLTEDMAKKLDIDLNDYRHVLKLKTRWTDKPTGYKL